MDQVVITFLNRITARLFNPWIKAEHKGNLLFINEPEEQQNGEDNEENFPTTRVLEAISRKDMQ